MLLWLRGFLGVVLIALVVVGAAQASGSASPFGTWLGTPKFPHKHDAHEVYDPIKLVAGPVWVQVESTGLTGASHDATDAKSTCTTRYRFSSPLSAAGWRIYVHRESRRSAAASAADRQRVESVDRPLVVRTGTLCAYVRPG